ncbi:MAG: DUF2804 family protein [Candidatus Lokiarchaeota archaeon]|nr:DUF2804 family protein [Candidatus Lokiarchaeota archaeon]MBD3198627.1 DUF2804 family protein [Candidatus Lokiarchaeota archaeon]
MGEQNEITEPSDLFNEDGSLVQKGWARKPILNYNKENIGKSWWRIKEWDHYSVLNDDFGFQLTIGDIGYLTQMSFVWLDFKNKNRADKSTMKFFTKSKILPLSSLEDSLIEFQTDEFDASLEKKGDKRILTIDDPSFIDEGIHGSILLEDNPDWDNTVVVTGYEDPKRFYYNHKINIMPAEGNLTIGNKKYNFSPDSSFGLLDWGRGIWPYKTHWLWGSACGMVDNVPVAFNIGYGFGLVGSKEGATHTENIVFYNGKAHKLDEITFHHENRDPTKSWKFTSNDGRFELILEPIIPHKEKLNFGIIRLDSSLLHGYYSGTIILDDGKEIKVKNMLGHAEDIYWRW